MNKNRTNPIRVYADTSVFGGVFDDEFSEGSLAFFDLVRLGRLKVITTPLVQNEIANAPKKVQELFLEFTPIFEPVGIGDDAVRLQLAYLGAGILTPKSNEDALHVAAATTNKCTAIASWNFKHIVNEGKIGRYNEINRIYGYKELKIQSPLEVVRDEKKV